MDTEQIILSSKIMRMIELQAKALFLLCLNSYLKRFEFTETTTIRKIELRSRIELERV